MDSPVLIETLPFANLLELASEPALYPNSLRAVPRASIASWTGTLPSSVDVRSGPFGIFNCDDGADFAESFPLVSLPSPLHFLFLFVKLLRFRHLRQLSLCFFDLFVLCWRRR